MTHAEHTRFALNHLVVEHGPTPFHNDVEGITAGPLAVDGSDGVNWESAWIDLGGEG